MEMQPVHERLRQARLAKRLDLHVLAERIGVRAQLLEAIETGQYDALPHGLYGRVAIRAFADALDFDADAILRQVGDQLIPVEDPIAGLARIRGVRPQVAVDSAVFAWPSFAGVRPQWLSWAGVRPHVDRLVAHLGDVGQAPYWRGLAATAIDGGISLILLMILVAVTVTLFGRPVLSAAAGPAFGVVGLLLAATYFGVFGGIGGQTPGARVAGVKAVAPAGAPIDLAGVVTRTIRAATRDAVVVEQSAAWIRGISAGYRSSGNRRDRPQAEQPAGW
jgi:transcriptional regulator with XRE-family HTH domain